MNRDDNTTPNPDRPALIAGHFPNLAPTPAPNPPGGPPAPTGWIRSGSRKPEYIRQPFRKVKEVVRVGAKYRYTLECGHPRVALTRPSRITGFKCRACRDQHVSRTENATP